MAKDFYGILEVSPRARERVIQAAFRELCKEYPNDSDKLKVLIEAKETLLDAPKRKAYDKDRGLKVGKVIGNYRLISEIASGGFGTTYLGEHTYLKTKVCIKHASEVSPQDEEIMMQEAKAVWDLRHWAIPAVRDIIKLEDGSLAIVQSYIPGPTIANFVEKHGGMEAEHVCWIAERCLNALQYLADNGVVHGDVKPQNVIFQTESHSVVLVDYGLSLVRPRHDTVNKGYTPYFASPEQEKGMTLVPESDLYSLGMTMIYALGGDVAAKSVPDDTPDEVCKFIKRLIPYQVSSRPNWKSENLCKTISEVRQKAFGRRASNMKPLKF